jgi:hypothetical protein
MKVFWLVLKFKEEKRTFTKIDGGNMNFFSKIKNVILGLDRNIFTRRAHETQVGSGVRSSRRSDHVEVPWTGTQVGLLACLENTATVQLNRPSGTQTRELIPSFNLFFRRMVLVFKDSNQSFTKAHAHVCSVLERKAGIVFPSLVNILCRIMHPFSINACACRVVPNTCRHGRIQGYSLVFSGIPNHFDILLCIYVGILVYICV